jgi:hypothetical protein
VNRPYITLLLDPLFPNKTFVNSCEFVDVFIMSLVVTVPGLLSVWNKQINNDKKGRIRAKRGLVWRVAHDQY